jgi:EpsI family protein
MKRESLGTTALVVALLAVGAAAWGLALRPPLRVDASRLGTLPERVDGWQSEDVPLESTVESMLRADFNLQRVYQHPLGEPVWLYVGYYGTERGGRPEHTPEACYRAHGWQIRERRRLGVPASDGLHVNEYVVEQGGRRQLVHFWFRSYRSTGMTRGVDQTLDQVVGRLLEGRADGALVRLSTLLDDGDLAGARSRLLAFAAALEGQIAQHWPDEAPSS